MAIVNWFHLKQRPAARGRKVKKKKRAKEECRLYLDSGLSLFSRASLLESDTDNYKAGSPVLTGTCGVRYRVRSQRKNSITGKP